MGLIDPVALQRVGNFLVTRLKQQLLIQDQVASGRLINSIEDQVIEGSDSTSLIVLMAPHYIWAENGRNKGGKRPPLDAIIQWVLDKGLESGDKEVISAAWAIQTFIWKNGTSRIVNGKKKRDFIQTVLDQTQEELFNMTSEAVFTKFEATIENIAKEATIKINKP